MEIRDATLRLAHKAQLSVSTPFDPTACPRSKILHLDYTGPLPDVCASGTRYFQVSCHGGYINIQPLPSLRHEHTTVALRNTVEFFRQHGVEITEIRMDNQQSSPLLLMAKALKVQWDLVSPHVKTLTGRSAPSAQQKTTSFLRAPGSTPNVRTHS